MMAIMMSKCNVVLGVSMLTLCLLCSGTLAKQEVPENIKMDSGVYKKHKKAIVTFSHKSHYEDYEIACKQCHHEFKDGKNVWKKGDAVQNCDACHDEAKAPRGSDAPKLTKEEKITKYHYSAIHENCKGCHKDLKRDGKDTGPTSCNHCHAKEGS
jgi:hypothetical protein